MEKPHLLPPPHQYNYTTLNSEEIREALEKSREALLNLTSSSTSQQQHHAAADSDDVLIKKLFLLNNVENLFLVDTTPEENDNYRSIQYLSYGPREEHGAWEWGSRDMMFDFRHDDDDDDASTTQQQQQRMAILTAAANLTGGAVHLLDMYLREEEERGWVEALSLAADHDAGHSSLLICADEFRDVYGLLSALKKSNGIKHLSLQQRGIEDACIKVLREFTSLTSLHLQCMTISPEFVGGSADLRPSDSPLAASLQRLHISPVFSTWSRTTGFLHHLLQLKELSLQSFIGMKEEKHLDFMDHLAPPEEETAALTPVHDLLRYTALS